MARSEARPRRNEQLPVLPAPEPLAPLGGTPAAPVAFAWAAVPGATGYRLQVAPSATFTSGVYVVTTTAATGAVLPSWQRLRPGATYHWRVQARTGAGDGLWSAPLAFTAP